MIALAYCIHNKSPLQDCEDCRRRREKIRQNQKINKSMLKEEMKQKLSEELEEILDNTISRSYKDINKLIDSLKEPNGKIDFAEEKAIKQILILFKQYIKAKMPGKKDFKTHLRLDKPNFLTEKEAEMLVNYHIKKTIQETTKALLEDL